MERPLVCPSLVGYPSRPVCTQWGPDQGVQMGWFGIVSPIDNRNGLIVSNGEDHTG